MLLMALFEGLLDGNFQAMWYPFSCGLVLYKLFSPREGQFQKATQLELVWLNKIVSKDNV